MEPDLWGQDAELVLAVDAVQDSKITPVQVDFVFARRAAIAYRMP